MTDRASIAARTAALRDTMYHRLLAALRETGPDAPNQCEGWVSRDMASHIWLMKHDPVAMPGIISPRFEEFTAERAQKAHDRVGGYEAMLDRLAEEDGARTPLVGDTLMLARTDLGEWYVHLRDVLVPNGMPEDPMDIYTRRSLWLQIPVIARLQRRDAVLVEPTLRRTHELGWGQEHPEEVPTVTGDAGDLLCWVFGRAADVEVA